MKMKTIVVAAAIPAMFASTAAHALDGDAAAGETVFRKCMACHNVENDKAKVGPTLQNVIGRQPGTLDGFRYSKAMQAFGAGKVWNEELLATYLANPREVVKGTKMVFPGLKKDQEIADVIAYVNQFSKTP